MLSLPTVATTTDMLNAGLRDTLRQTGPAEATRMTCGGLRVSCCLSSLIEPRYDLNPRSTLLGPPPDRGYQSSRPSDRGPERERRPYQSDGPSSGPKPLPDRPPYTAFVGNLPFDIVEADVEAFFDPLRVSETG